ncbi:MAG: Na+/H+ antiporter subunit E [Nitrospirae bacterium]|nr:Na+/H+ antiporter subunit E [Nitrospirota bacterium]
MSFILTAVIMFLFWILLSGEFGFILIASAIISCLFVSYLSHDLLIGKANVRLGLIRIFRFIKYLPWLMWQIVLSNIDLVKRTLHPKMPISPTIFSFKNELRTEMGMVALANSITLTPGTITVDVNEDEFIIHAVALELAEGLMEGEMQRRIKAIEGEEDV